MKIKYYDKLKAQIERGKQGLNKGIPFNNFTTLSDYIMNIQQGRYDLVFAGTSVGKSAFIDSTYIYGAIEFLQKNPDYVHNLEIIYYALEIKPEAQLAKHIAKKIWEDHGILTSTNEILSRGNHKIRPDVEFLVASYQKELEEIQNKYIHYRTSLNPDFLYKDLMGYAEKRGTITRNNDGLVIDYIPNNPGLITLIVIDHIGLIDLGKYSDLKAAIDKCSKNLVFFRNMFNFSPLVVVQMNRGSEQMDRRDNDNWMPMLSDIKNTANLSEDCNTAIGIASPFYYGIKSCLGYDITLFKDRYRLVKICKNRDGSTNLQASFLFIGEVGKYEQLNNEDGKNSKPETLKKIDQYYGKIKKTTS